MSSAAPDLDLLMVHADDHTPTIGGLTTAAAQGQRPATAAAAPASFWDEGGDPNDLGLQRWGVIAPRGPEGDRLLALVDPLIRRRQAQQADAVRVYRVPPRMTQDEAARWRKQEFETGADLDIEVPRYQLILGDLDQVPLAIQQVQQSDGYVGRLAFTREDDYAAYVDKLLRWEDLSSGTSQSDALFYSVHDGTAATAAGHAALVAPGVEVVRRRHAAGQYPARDITLFGDGAPSPDELLTRAAAAEASVLFTLSHGEGAPRGGWPTPEDQRRRQGALSLGRAGQLTGDDLHGRTFLPGGVWFMLACYGAGTPADSAYRHWLAQLAAAGQFRGQPEAVLAGLPGPHDRPFVAALPQAALASAGGPLAFIGHVDLAWTYGFQDRDDGGTHDRPARYMGVTRSLLKRDRAGVALRELLRFFDQTNVELTALLDRDEAARASGNPERSDRTRQAHLWMLRQDLAAYVLLGDPAVRLPRAPSAPRFTPPRIEVPRLADAVHDDPGPHTATAGHPGEFKADTAELAAPATAEPGEPTEPAISGDRNERRTAQAKDRARVACDPRQDALESAVLRYLAARREIQAAASSVGLELAALARLVAAYREHGRQALRDA